MPALGAAGLFLTAIFSPCCFPVFAFAATALGLGGAELFGGWTMWIFQAMVLISVAGLYISYRRHSCLYPLLVAIPGALLIFYGYHINSSNYWLYFVYAGMLGLLLATTGNYRRNKLNSTCHVQSPEKVAYTSTINCPNCGHKEKERMPTDACVYFYDCKNCKSTLKPLPGDCCVFCSYGTVKCPPIQSGASCC